MDLRDVKPSVISWFIVGFMAMTFIVASKYVVNTYNNVLTRYAKDFVNTA